MIDVSWYKEIVCPCCGTTYDISECHDVSDDLSEALLNEGEFEVSCMNSDCLRRFIVDTSSVFVYRTKEIEE